MARLVTYPGMEPWITEMHSVQETDRFEIPQCYMIAQERLSYQINTTRKR